jgi:hypothetical protein
MDNSQPDGNPRGYRRDDQPPPVVTELGWRYHHMGVPTDIPRPDEKYIPQYRMYVAGFSSSPYGVEWMRFEPDCPLPPIVQRVPHVAFEVDDLDAALLGRAVLLPPGCPSEGVRSAMILHNGAPVELLTFGKRK